VTIRVTRPCKHVDLYISNHMLEMYVLKCGIMFYYLICLLYQTIRNWNFPRDCSASPSPKPH